VIATMPKRPHIIFVDETHVAAWFGPTLTIIDVTTRATKQYDRPFPITSIDTITGLAYLVDTQHHVWRFELANEKFTEIVVEGRVDQAVPSPDGKWIALAGEAIWVAEAKNLIVEKVQDGPAFELSWDPHDQVFAAIGAKSIFDIHLHPEITRGEYMVTNLAAVRARDTVYSAGLSGWTIGQNMVGEADARSALLGLYVTQGDLVVGADPEDLRIFDGKADYLLPMPSTPITLVRASPRSPYLLAVVANEILVWNVADMFPQRVPVPTFTQIIPMGPDRMWTVPGSNHGPASSIDVHTGKVTEMTGPTTMTRSSPPSGAYVIARLLLSRKIVVFRPDGTSEPVPFEGITAIAIDDKRAVIATPDNEIVLYDIDTHTSKPLTTLPAKIDRLSVRENWMVAYASDGTLVRMALATGAVTTTRIGAHTDPHGDMPAVSEATKDGDVVFSSGTKLQRWRRDGTIELRATLPRGIREAELVADDRILILSDNYTPYLVRDAVVRLPALGQNPQWTPGTPYVIGDDETRGVVVVDLDTTASWRISRATRKGMTPFISGDGSVVVMRDADDQALAVALWPLDLPRSAAETARWVEQMTNATFDPKTGMLGWRD